MKVGASSCNYTNSWKTEVNTRFMFEIFDICPIGPLALD